MKKEEIYVKLTDKNREKVFKILDMFGQELNFDDNLCRYNLIYDSGDSINDYPAMIFYDGYWYLCKSIYGLKKTKVKPRELKQILAKEHLKKGDIVVVKNSMGKWILELTGNNVHKFEFSKSYDKKCINAPHVRTIEYGIFIRFATEEECKLLQSILFECASCEQELDVSQRSDDKPNLCNNCFKPEEHKTTDGKNLARYGDVCKFYNINPGVFVVGYLAYFGKAHDKKVYYCVGLGAPFYNADPITKEEAIKLLFGNDLRQ